MPKIIDSDVIASIKRLIEVLDQEVGNMQKHLDKTTAYLARTIRELDKLAESSSKHE